jgi:hypothetical protein
MQRATAAALAAGFEALGRHPGTFPMTSSAAALVDSFGSVAAIAVPPTATETLLQSLPNDCQRRGSTASLASVADSEPVLEDSMPVVVNIEPSRYVDATCVASCCHVLLLSELFAPLLAASGRVRVVGCPDPCRF